jgi:hypothetical protein
LLRNKAFLVGISILATLYSLLGKPAVAESLNVAFSVFPPLHNPKALATPDRSGVLVEFYKNVLPILGYKVKLLQLPPKRINSFLNKGENIDMYNCADFSRSNRKHYAFGPPFVFLNVLLYQNAKLPILSNYHTLKNQDIIKQHGFNGLKKLLDPSIRFLEGHSASVPTMFARGRANYLLDIKERMETMLKTEKGLPPYRTYPIRSFIAHLCLNKRFKDAENRVIKIHEAMVEYQDSPAGQNIIKKYGYTGRFGRQIKTAGEK